VNAHVLWYITRATGIVALLLLTGTTVLGIVTSVRYRTEAWPRFAWQDLHRRLSLPSVVFLGFHIGSTVLDGYAPIGWLSAVIPFTSSYRRLWLGLGTVAVDLFLAVGISSLVRNRIAPRVWRALHWLAYASWPIAVVHALGTGTDPRLRWVLALVVVCVASVLGAVVWRLSDGWPARAGLRGGLGAAGALSLVVSAAWAAAGPLRPGWAAKAGTPASLLGARAASATLPSGQSAGTTPPAGTTGSAGSASAATASLPAPPYQDTITGTVTQKSLSNGQVEVDIDTTATGGGPGVLAVRLIGVPDGNGGVAMQQSGASFGPAGNPTEYRGRVVGLSGTRVDLALSDAAGTTLDLRVSLSIDGSAVQGVLVAGTSGIGGGEAGGDG
jgi:hypothetical protein